MLCFAVCNGVLYNVCQLEGIMTGEVEAGVKAPLVPGGVSFENGMANRVRAACMPIPPTPALCSSLSACERMQLYQPVS